MAMMMTKILMMVMMKLVSGWMALVMALTMADAAATLAYLLRS